MSFEEWIVEEERRGFFLGDFDEASVAEMAHGDIGDAGLSESEEGARTADFQIFLGEEEAVIAFDESVEAVVGAVFPRKEKAVGLMFAASDAPAELVELGESEPVGILDDHDGGVGHVDAHFDDGCRDEHVRPAIFEIAHDLFFFGGFHFPVEEPDGEFGEDFFGKFLVLGFGGFDFGEGGGLFDKRQNDENLPTLLYFLSRESEDGFSRVSRRGDFGNDGNAMFWHLVEYGDVEIAQEGNGECSRYGSRRQCEEVRRGGRETVL